MQRLYKDIIPRYQAKLSILLLYLTAIQILQNQTTDVNKKIPDFFEKSGI
jgi:hypothetical protein